MPANAGSFFVSFAAFGKRLIGPGLVMIAAAGTVAGQTIDFNRQVKPILSENCFKCHGPDEASREAGLRFDLRESALKPAKSGEIAIVPGNPDESELILRVTDEHDWMPPEETGKRLKPHEIEILRRWIAEGAHYAPHWSFVAPTAATPPAAKNPAWARNPIDLFVLAQLESQGLQPVREADKPTLLRRVSFDLTGLPPAVGQLDAFLADTAPDAYERVVDRLLASPAYGERMAVDWLDAARYADSNGFFRDNTRQIWPWRDWVIQAFNRNLPYDRFTIEQLAGDLMDDARDGSSKLQASSSRETSGSKNAAGAPPAGTTPNSKPQTPNSAGGPPTPNSKPQTPNSAGGRLTPNSDRQARLIATGFNRNHMVSGETGIIDEEYRVEYVADRLETTSTVFLGLTVACARCHDHKYDPISQKDYFKLFAFFNSGVEKGTISPDDPPPVMDVATPAQRAELERLIAARGAAESAFNELAAPLQPHIAAWKNQAASELQPPCDRLLAYVDFEPEDLKDQGTKGPRDQGTNVISENWADSRRGSGVEESGAAKGGLPRAMEKGSVYHDTGLIGRAAGFDGMQHLELPADLPLAADQPWTVGVWVKATSSPLSCLISKIEPAGDRRGFELIWQKGQLHVNLVDRWVVSAIEVSTKETARRNDWAHVVVSYDGSRKAGGVRVYIDGIETALSVGRDTLQGSISNGEPVRIGRRDSGLGFYGQLDELRILSRTVTAQEARTWYWSERLHGVLAAEKTDARQNKLLLDCYVERHGDPASREASRRVAGARKAEETFRARLPKTLVMQEVENPRPTHLLKGGQYDAPGELVHAGVPEILPPMPADLPRNRLGLATWIASPENPLTARVAVNRLWRQCFGEGLVATAEDFGAQGELPTHPELLDWLAVQFVKSGWDVKQLLRLIVTSATYRQESAPTRELLQRDPDNRLLARGPRFRLGGEMIRDQALAVSGLLVEKFGGPPVKPYQPPGLWEAVSYNGELSYERDRGEGLWRRSVYTYWKRTSPPPGVQVFDGPTREICMVRRPRTNTPLQALLLLNDEGFVEAARALAAETLALRGTGASREQRASAMFRRVTAREPQPREIATLAGLYDRQRARFEKDRAAAQALIAVGDSPRGRDLDPVELATWTVVAQAVLNLDEVIMRR